MEIQLQELIEQIKKDGVQTAEAQAKSIVDSANEQAEKIIADAKKQAEIILANAKTQTEKMTASGEDAIRQAGRNLLISFRESISRELKAIIGENVNAVYSSDSFMKLIVSVVEGWSKNPDTEDITLILNEKDVTALKDCILAALKDKLSKGITLKANDNFDGGFRISVNNGDAYYDYSAESVVEMLSGYLNPEVTRLLKEAK